jgi:flotillin
MFFWHVPAPNEAMLVSGVRRRSNEQQFRVVTGHGCFVLPIKQKARFLSLSLREAVIAEECITTQGIRLRIRAIAAFKIGDDIASIANAARRFIAEQNRMEELVGRIFAGHLRSIIGSLTVEEIIRERDRLAQEVKDGSHAEMEKLGIVVDSLLVQEIEDATGYINNIAAPHAAAIASLARIAAAKADQEATQREQQASALKAEYVRDAEIKRAGYAAETEQAQARAAQAGPLAQAESTQKVIEQQTTLAELEAQLTEKKLESEVRRPADAEAYRTRTIADGDRDKVKAETEAEAFRLRTLAEANRDTIKFSTEADANRRLAIAKADGEAEKVRAAADKEAKQHEADGDAYAERTVAAAEAQAINVRADALSDGNQALIAANKLIDVLPDLVEAAARGIASSNLTVLSGAEGVNQMVAGVVSQGLTIYETLRNSISAMGGQVDGDPNGVATPEAEGELPVESVSAPAIEVGPRPATPRRRTSRTRVDKDG